MSRITIKDISKMAGVSPAAVSFALNGRAGVSEDTRKRITKLAREAGWQPSAAAVALSAGKAGALGLVIARSEDSFTGERFFMHFIAGVERVLTARDVSLLLQFAADESEELRAYQLWHSQSRVDAVLLVDTHANDLRPAALQQMELPFVAVGTPADYPHLHVEAADGAAMSGLVDHFADGGYTRLAYVSGDPRTLHTMQRIEAFEARCEQRRMAHWVTISTNYTQEAGRRASADLLAGAQPPDGIIYDNEVLTAGGVLAVLESGRSFPEDVGLASFEDSPVCQFIRPQITALQRDPAQLGAQAAQLLLDKLDGSEVSHAVAEVPSLAVRGSSAPRP